MASSEKAATKDEPAKKRCFVIGPIGGAGTPTRTHADWLLEGIILPAFDENFADYKVERSDKITEPGMIDSQIINLLIDADLVIADMSHLNANAFYEMGIRHMAQRPIIHMFLNGSDIPFDVKPYRAIPFSVSHPSDLIAARKDLISAVADAISADHKVDNPVTRAKGQAKFELEATPKERLLIEEVKSITDRLSAVEKLRIPSVMQYANDQSSNDHPDFKRYNILISFIDSVQDNQSERNKAINEIKKLLSRKGVVIGLFRQKTDCKIVFELQEETGTDIYRIIDLINSHPAVAVAGQS